VKDRPIIELVDLGCFGRPARLMWHKHRWCCPPSTCLVGSWTGQYPRIAAARLGLTDRPGRAVGEAPGGPARPDRERGRPRTRV
jgi:hypothetical protein